MPKRALGYSLIVFASAMCLFSTSVFGAEPKGAKALFDSGEGPTVRMSTNKAPTSPQSQPVASQRYVGISYELLLLTNDGQIRKVTRNRTFTGGERMLMRVVTNRSGNLKIVNIGPTGNTNVLFDDFIEAYTMTQVPRNSDFRFVGASGTETLLIMLGNTEASGGAAPQVTAWNPPPPPPSQPPGAPPPPSAPPGNAPSQVAGIAKIKPLPPVPSPAPSEPSSALPPPSSSDAGNMPPPPPPPPNAIVSNISSAKSIKGGKDIVTEDQMQSSFAVVSPRNAWHPVKSGTKDIVVESTNGTNYGVVPASAVSDGGILTLTVTLKHR